MDKLLTYKAFQTLRTAVERVVWQIELSGSDAEPYFIQAELKQALTEVRQLAGEK